MNCQKCGCTLPNGVTCCPNCGTFSDGQMSNNNQQTQIQTVSQQAISQIQQPQVQQNQSFQQNMNPQVQMQNMSQQSMNQMPNQNIGLTQSMAQIQQPQVQQNQSFQQNMNPQVQMQNMSQQSMNQMNNQPTSIQQPINMQQPYNQIRINQRLSTPPQEIEEPKKKKGFLKIIFIMLILIAAGIVAWPKLKMIFYKPKVESVDEMFKSTSFWLPNTDEKIAIFNVDGEQLTDFIYTDASPKFVNNTAMVKNDKDQYAIITSLGKELVKFGKYEKIKDIAAGYIGQTSDNKNFLYNRAGQLIKELGPNPIVFGYTFGLNGYGSNLYVGIFDNNQFTIINYAGEELLIFPYVENEHTIDKSGEKISPKVDLYDDKYLSVFYNQHNYIINIITKEKIIDFESPLEFNIAAADEEKNEIFLKSVSKNSGWNRDESEIFEYKLIRNKEVVYTKTHEEEIDEASYNNGIIEFESYHESYILTETGDKIPLDGEEYIAGYADYNNYIKSNKDRNKELYVNNELKKVFNCIFVETSNANYDSYAKHGIYVLKECEVNNDKSEYNDENYDEYDDEFYEKYDETRNFIIKTDGTILNDKIYYYISDFDEFGNLTVSEDGKTKYLIDSSGKKISKDYYFSEYDAEWEDRISQLGHNNDNELFVAKKDEDNEVIFDKSGKEYITANSIHRVGNDLSEDIFVILEYDDHYTVYNATKQKEIIKSKEIPTCRSGYIMITDNGKIEFYSYTTGKLFYTIEKK